MALLVRQDQDLSAEAKGLDDAMIAVSTEPEQRDAAAEERSTDRLAAISAERAELQKTLASEFPDYAALSNPQPLAASDIQRLLSGDEALVAFSVGDRESYVFALTHDGAAWHKINRGHSALANRVARFRGGLDPRMLLDEQALAESHIKRELFDLGAAYELYYALAAGRGAHQKQTAPSRGAERCADCPAVPPAGDRGACGFDACCRGLR